MQEVNVSLVVYFDTNVVRNLSEGRVPYAEKVANVISKIVKEKRLVIAPSFEVLYELLSAPDLPSEMQIKNAQYYDSIVDWTYALKPSNQMLQEDIFSLAREGGPSTPFRAIDEKQSGFIRSIRAGYGILPSDEWDDVVKKSRCENKRFVDQLFNNFVKRLPQKGKTELKNNPQKTWQKWWGHGGLAEVLADSLANALRVKGKYSLLTLPTVRAAVGYILHTWYRQIIDGARLKPTTHYDFRNAVLTGGVGKIVTQDKALQSAIEHVPNLPVRVYSLDELINILV
ncbi:MAG: hypothetical protein NTX52_13580 [Planctomycetota bacterium]|nr:hypothetical protein [Planctomycetota bacterium]